MDVVGSKNSQKLQTQINKHKLQREKLNQLCNSLFFSACWKLLKHDDYPYLF